MAPGRARGVRSCRCCEAAPLRPPRALSSAAAATEEPPAPAGAGWGAPGSGAAPTLPGASATPRSALHPGWAGGTGGGAGCRGEGAGCGGGRGAAIPRAGTAAADGGKVSGRPLPSGRAPLMAAPRGGGRCSRAVDPAVGAPLPPPLLGGERGRRGRGCPPPRLPPFLPPGRGADAGFVSACPGWPRRARVAAAERGPPGGAAARCAVQVSGRAAPAAAAASREGGGRRGYFETRRGRACITPALFRAEEGYPCALRGSKSR